MTYTQAIEYIHSVVWKGSRPGLERITELLHALDDPQNDLKFIHVAGTNGKGSFCAMTESVLRASGLRTGLFVSPYIKHFNERICYCGKPITDEELAEVTAYVRPFADAMSDSPTEFELITAIGLVYFKQKGCDVIVLETGMGGRLDSTNVIRDPLLTVITGIAMDHTAFLGDTVEAIAAEKAGIIKKSAPVLWGGHDAVARRVIEQKASEMGVRFVAAEDTPTRVLEMTLSGTRVTFGAYEDIRIPLLGTYQPQNLSCVLAGLTLLREMGLPITDASLRAGLSSVRWRGRFEKLCEQPLILSDGAHNPEGVAAAVAGIKHYFGGERVLLLTGVMADKDYTGMVADLAPIAKEAFCLTPDNPRALDANAFAEAFLAQGISAKGYPTVGDAVAAAVAKARESGTPLISLGSLYMYAEVTDTLEQMGVIAPE